MVDMRNSTLCFSRETKQMFQTLATWLEKRRTIRRRYQADARMLLLDDEPGAYYAAQRLAARSRSAGNMAEFWHWAKVASEVARLSPHTEMDLHVVQTIADEEKYHVRR
jgi:hypothetical protein